MEVILFQFRQLAPYVVGVFFFLTGYGLNKSLLAKGDAYMSHFPQKRFSAIIPSFIISIVLFQIVLFVCGNLNLSGVMEELATGKTSHLLPYCWFVIIVSIVYMLFYFSSVVSDKKVVRAIIFSIFILLLYIIIRKMKFESYWYISLTPILVGYLYAIYEDKINKWPTRIMVTLIGLASSLALSYHWVFSDILMAFAPIVVIYVLHSLEVTTSKSLHFLGKISYELYLVHGIVIYVFKFIPDFYFFIILVFATSIIAAFSLKLFISKIHLIS